MKALSLLTAIAILISALVSCAVVSKPQNYSVTSSSAKAEELLTTRGGR